LYKVFFSIIIPTFNAENTIERCLNSITCQSFKNFEILLMDGNSTDSTATIVNKYDSSYPNISWIASSDQGIYDAMNKGLKASQGEWIYFMGADDTLFGESVLNNIFNNIRNFPLIDIFYGNVFSTRFDGIYDGLFSIDKIYCKNISHQAIFYKKQIFKKTGLFDLKYKVYADWDHNFKWLLSDKLKFKYLDLVIANYADGGFSSLNGDEKFNLDKDFKYLLSGRNTLSLNTRLFFFRTEFMKAFKTRHKKRLFFLLFFSPNLLW
jgi:glycosyltransferase involved in cell wall biosynthesis